MISRALTDDEAGALLFALGADEVGHEARQRLLVGVQRRRVNVLESIRRGQPDRTSEPVADLIGAWFGRIRRNPQRAGILTDPFVGIWAEAALNGARPVDDTVAVGRLLAPALVEEPFEVELSLRDGMLHLPGFGGTLRIPETASVTARLDAEAISIDAPEGRAVIRDGEATTSAGLTWTTPTRRRVTTNGRSLSIQLGSDDSETTAVGPSTPLSLSGKAVESWTSVLARSWERIVHRHPAGVASIPMAASVIVPQRSPNAERHVSSTHADGFGAIGISYTDHIPTFAVGLVHEARHAWLNAALTMFDLYLDDPTPRFLAGWRDDPRPIGALLQGACAFAAVTAFCRSEYRHSSGESQRHPALETIRWWTFTTEAIDQLRSSRLLTPLGERFVDGLDHLLGERPHVEDGLAEEAIALLAVHSTRTASAVVAGAGATT